MPTLPLPPGGAALHGGDLPVSDGSDVLAQFADAHRRPEAALVRDSLADAFSRIHITYQDESAALLAQLDPRRATGDALLELAIEHGVTLRTGEDLESLRARIFTSPDVVSPAAIVKAVNALLAPYTTMECELVEPEVDGWFVEDGTSTEWGAFLGTPGTQIRPHYPDRYYADDSAENGGFVIANNDPGGLIVSRGYPRNFHLRLPDIAASDADFAFCIDSSTEIMAISNGTNASGSELDGTVITFIFNSAQTSDEVYDAIVGLVESIKGQGVSWSALVDPSLV